MIKMILTRSEVRLLCISQCLVTLSVPEPDLHWAPVHLPEDEYDFENFCGDYDHHLTTTAPVLLGT